MFRLLASFAMSAVLVAGSAGAQMVVADGTTATGVVGDDALGYDIAIAPASSSGISLNGFERFSVPGAGVRLDNRDERARTIVAEVSGTTPSLVYGDIEVQGTRAHFILANPNGIVVDNGRFLNMGQVVLGAGTVSTRSFEIAPGVTRENVVLTTSAGSSVAIEGQGLSGEMDALHVLAAEISVDGPVTVESPVAGSFARFAAGHTTTEFDSAIVPGNLDQQFATTVSNGVRYDGVAFALGSAGGINAGRIEVLVNDEGAGVRMSGQAVSSVGGIVISANGDIGMSGARVQSARSVQVRGRSVRTSQSQIAWMDGLDARATDPASVGLVIEGGSMTGPRAVFVSASEFRLGEGALVEADAGSVQIAADADIVFEDSTLSATDTVLVETLGSLSLSGADVSGFVLQFDAEDTLSMAEGRLSATALAELEGADLRFSATTSESGITVDQGALALRSVSGDIENTGMVLTGTVAQPDAGYDHAVTLESAGSYLARSDTSEARAIVFGQAGSVSVTAADGDVRLENSRIVANGDISVTADAGEIWVGVDLPDGTTTPATADGQSRTPIWWSAGLLSRSTREITHDWGALGWDGQDATIISSGGDIALTSTALTVRGGDITANPDDAGQTGVIEIDVSRLWLEPVLSGDIGVRRQCNPFCRYRVRGSGVTVTGGEISAAGSIRITADDEVRLMGGQIYAVEDVDVTSPDIVVQAVAVPAVLYRPGGVYNGFRSEAAQLYFQHQLGSIIADTGTLSIDTDSPVLLDSGALFGGQAIDLAAGSTIVARRGTEFLMADDRLGWFGEWPFVGDH